MTSCATFLKSAPFEVQLASEAGIGRAAEAVREFVEAGAQVEESPSEAVVRFRTSKPENEMGGLLAKLIASEIDVTQFREIPTIWRMHFFRLRGIARKVVPRLGTRV